LALYTFKSYNTAQKGGARGKADCNGFSGLFKAPLHFFFPINRGITSNVRMGTMDRIEKGETPGILKQQKVAKGGDCSDEALSLYYSLLTKNTYLLLTDRSNLK